VCIRTLSLLFTTHTHVRLFFLSCTYNPSSTLIDLQVLYFHTLTNAFSRNPFPFHIYTNPGVSGRCAFFRLSVLCACPFDRRAQREKLPKSFPDIPLRTLEISLRSFSTSRPLFSIVCGLFLQNTGGMGVGRGSAVYCSPLTDHGHRTTLDQHLQKCIKTKDFISL